MLLVKYRIKPSKGEYAKASWERLKVKLPVRKYMIFGAVILIGLIYSASIGPESIRGHASDAIFYFLLIWIIPMFFVQGIVNYGIKEELPKLKDYRFFICESGVGWRTSSFKTIMKWDNVKRIFETENYIHLKFAGGGFLTIYKSQLSEDSLITVLKVLSVVPVEEKELLNK